MRVLGIMSGTSLDGVDCALCSIRPGKIHLEKMWSVAFPQLLQGRLHAAASNACSSYELAQLHHDLGRFYAACVTKRGVATPELAGLHGQTIFHNPAADAPATFQAGEPAYIAARLGVPVISNFRAGDMSIGGQGAPLATAFHVQIFGERGKHVCVNNLGGISNSTSIDWRNSHTPQVIAFDTGPANMLIDMAMRYFTKGRLKMDLMGRWARRGRACQPLLAQWLKMPYFALPPPKSTGRELFGEPFFERALRKIRRLQLRPEDAVATFTEFTARTIANTYRQHVKSVPDLVIFTGGGAANATLLQWIERNLAEVGIKTRVKTSERIGWPRQAIEPAAFAWLAWLRWRRQPGNLPETTGARRAILLGQITEL